MKNSKKIFVVVNVDWFFLSHRLPVALAAQRAGWDVTIVTADTEKLKDIEAKGLKTISLPCLVLFRKADSLDHTDILHAKHHLC